MIYGEDPITKESLEINEWLNESDDNILLIIDKKLYIYIYIYSIINDLWRRSNHKRIFRNK